MRFKPYNKYDPRRYQPGVWLAHKISMNRHARMHTALILCAYRHPHTRIPGVESYCGECSNIVKDWKFP